MYLLLSFSANLVQVIKNDANFSQEFLSEMIAVPIRQTLEALHLISPDVAKEIERAKTRNEANNILLQCMKEEADENRVQRILEIASKAEGYGQMNAFAYRMLRNQHGGLFLQ